MLKGNLSTRPFYNDRLVTVAIALAAGLVVVASAMNAAALVGLLSERAAARTRLEADTGEAARVRAEAEALRRGVDQTTLVGLAASAREANALIDQRRFSWTGLLGRLEGTLPADVRLTAISPRVDQGRFRIALAVVARDLNDVDAFIDALLETGAFYDVAPVEQRANDDGTYRAVVEASYLDLADGDTGAAPSDAPAGQGGQQ